MSFLKIIDLNNSEFAESRCICAKVLKFKSKLRAGGEGGGSTVRRTPRYKRQSNFALAQRIVNKKSCCDYKFIQVSHVPKFLLPGISWFKCCYADNAATKYINAPPYFFVTPWLNDETFSCSVKVTLKLITLYHFKFY